MIPHDRHISFLAALIIWTILLLFASAAFGAERNLPDHFCDVDHMTMEHVETLHGSAWLLHSETARGFVVQMGLLRQSSLRSNREETLSEKK
jgi:hypothetical protein